MKKIIVFLLFFLIFSNYNAQSVDYNNALNDVVSENEQGQAQKITGTTTYVSKINLTGNYTMMVIVIGFPDVPKTLSWPQLTTNVNYPHRGAFPDGTTLKEYIVQNGPVNIEDWFGEGFEYFFDKQSFGKYTVDVVWPKTNTNGRYLTDSDLSYWGTGNNIIWDNWDEIGNEVAQKMVADDPNVFDGVDMVQLTFDGVDKDIYQTGYSAKLGWEISHYTNLEMTVMYILQDLWQQTDNPPPWFTNFVIKLEVLEVLQVGLKVYRIEVMIHLEEMDMII